MSKIAFTMLVKFNNKLGNKLIDAFPKIQVDKETENFIIQNCMPDYKANEIISDSFYFNKEKIFCYVYFMQTQDNESERNCNQQSVVFVSNNYYKDLELVIKDKFKDNTCDLYYSLLNHIRSIDLANNLDYFKKFDGDSNFLKPKTPDNTNKDFLRNNKHVDETKKSDVNNIVDSIIEFKCFLFLKNELPHLVESLIFYKKIKVISKLPSKLSKFKKYIDKIMFPFSLSNYYVYLSAFNNIKPISGTFCGVTHKNSHSSYNEIVLIDLDKETIDYREKDFNWYNVLKSLRIKEKNCPLQFLIDYFEQKKSFAAEKSRFWKAFKETDIYQEYVKKQSKLQFEADQQ